jgi:hypothetical protein
VVADYRAVLGGEHPFTLAAATDLAGVLRATGDVGQARTIDSEALGGLRRSVGADHPFTLSCANGLAADLIATGEAQRAREIALDTLSRSRVLRGAEHPDTLACAFNACARSTWRSTPATSWRRSSRSRSCTSSAATARCSPAP